MSEEPQRNGFLLFTDKVLKLVDGLKGIAMILAALSVGGASGTLIAGGISPDTAKAIADSTVKAQIAPLQGAVTNLQGAVTEARAEAKEAKAEVQAMREESRAAFGALMDALPAFKASVKASGQASAAAARKKKENDTLLINLTEAKP